MGLGVRRLMRSGSSFARKVIKLTTLSQYNRVEWPPNSITAVNTRALAKRDSIKVLIPTVKLVHSRASRLVEPMGRPETHSANKLYFAIILHLASTTLYSLPRAHRLLRMIRMRKKASGWSESGGSEGPHVPRQPRTCALHHRPLPQPPQPPATALATAAPSMLRVLARARVPTYTRYTIAATSSSLAPHANTNTTTTMANILNECCKPRLICEAVHHGAPAMCSHGLT